jgi:hypothetical protein
MNSVCHMGHRRRTGGARRCALSDSLARAQRAVRRPARFSRHRSARRHAAQHAAGPRFGFPSRPGRLSSPPRGVRMGRFSRSHYTPGRSTKGAGASPLLLAHTRPQTSAARRPRMAILTPFGMRRRPKLRAAPASPRLLPCPAAPQRRPSRANLAARASRRATSPGSS